MSISGNQWPNTFPFESLGNWNTVGEHKYDAQNRRIRKGVMNKGALNLEAGYSYWELNVSRWGAIHGYTFAPCYLNVDEVTAYFGGLAWKEPPPGYTYD